MQISKRLPDLIKFLILFSIILPPLYLEAGLIGDNIPISAVAYNQQNPHTIYLPNKNLYFVVWEDWRNITTTGADIRGRFIDENGGFCGDEIVITSASGNQTAPWAAYRDKDILDTPTGNDTILIAWQDTRGNGGGGYVYHRAMDVTNLNTTNCSGYVLGAETPVGYNQIERYVEPSIASATQNIGSGDSTKTTFSGTLTNTPVVPGTVRVTAGTQKLIDDGQGGLVGDGSGMIVYETGFVSVTFTSAPANGNVDVTYSYYTSWPPSTTPLGDQLQSRKTPKVSYDPVRDRFWIVWTESRSTLNRISELCFGFVPIAWEFGDTSFPGYVMLDGNTLTELPNDIGVNGADIIRNDVTRTNRLISASGTALKETYTYEYFTNINNITLSSDTTSPETFIVWQGARQKGVLTCNCADKNGNEFCDLADVVTSTFETSNYDDGLVHIYGLFDKEISQAVINSKMLDQSNSSNAYYPSVGFDPISGKFLTAWEDMRDGANTKIYGQLVLSGSGLYNNNILISYEDTDGDGNQDPNVANSKQTRPFVSYDAAEQRYFVVWQDGRNGSLSLENLDIYGQKVDAEGSLRGNNYPIFTLPSNQYYPTIAYNDITQEFLAVWKDARDADNSTCSSTGGVGTGNQPCGADVYGQLFTLRNPALTLLNMDNTPLTPPLLNNFQNPPGSGSVEVGLFATQSFKIRSTGDATLRIDSIDQTCGGTQASLDPFSFDGLPTELSAQDGTTLDLVPGAELTLTVRFTPPAGGSYNRCFIIRSDGGNPTVNLSALAVESNITVQPTSWDFGNVYVGSYGEKTFAVKNTGLASLTISSVNPPASPFSITNDGCSGQNITPGNTCNIVIRFTPTSAGVFNSQFGINSNDPDTPTLNVALTGTGLGAQDITVTPLSINFGNVQVGQSSQQTITVKNDGTAALTITSITPPTPPFIIISNNCPATLNIGASCQITVNFAPTSSGQTSSSVIINSNDPDEGSVVVNLSGVGVTTPDISVNPNVVNFADTFVGTMKIQDVTVSNIGTATLVILSLTNPTGDFAIAGNTCGGNIMPSGSCIIKISFAPTKAGYASSSFTINSNDPDTPSLVVPLSGTGIVTPDINVSPTGVNFGNVLLGQSSQQTITVKNDGTAALTINSISSPTSPFSIVDNTCFSILDPGKLCEITVGFSPSGMQNYSDDIIIISNDPDEANIVIHLEGYGVSPNIQLSKRYVNFGKVELYTLNNKTVVITNNGNTDLVITSITGPGFPFGISSDDCSGKTLLPSSTCTVIFSFNPTFEGLFDPYYAYIKSNDPDEPNIEILIRGEAGTLQKFEDVPDGYWASDFIYTIFNLGITQGCSSDPLMFCPENQVTREQMAVFIIRSMIEKGLLSPNFSWPSTPYFDDVSATSGSFKYIQKMKELNITSGCTANTYCPDAPVTRAQMAVFITKALGQSPSATCTGTVFNDVNASTVGDGFCRYIEKFATLGITSGCGNGNYCPSDTVTRAQMAVFLTKGFLQ